MLPCQSMDNEAAHRSHPAIIKRLKRALGHLRLTIEMLENRRPCVDLAQQLYAVENAVSAAKRVLIYEHIDHCLEAAAGSQKKGSLDEFKEIAKYL